MTRDQLYQIIQQSFSQAVQECRQFELEQSFQDNLTRCHANRSREWINCLAKQLLQVSKDNHSIVEDKFLAFYRGNDKDRQVFGLNEFLFDIVVAKMLELNTASGWRNAKANDGMLKAIEKAIWIVESEFQLKDSRALLVDMNKLALAKAKNKLFVMSLDPLSKMNTWAEQTLKTLTKGDDATVFLAKIPHPKDWSVNQHIELIEIL